MMGRFSQWLGKQGLNALIHGNCCEIAFNGGVEAHQREIDELKKQLIDQGQRFNAQSRRIKDLEYLNSKLQGQINATNDDKQQLKAGDRVYVDFVSESSTSFSGNHFKGYGVLDRAEDGRVYGRRDDGFPFTCLFGDVAKIEPNPNRSGVRVIAPSFSYFVGVE